MRTKSTYSKIEQSLISSLQNITVTKSNTGVDIVSFMSMSASVPIFTGHFPDQPIMPAVIQLSIVRLLCMEAVQTNLLNLLVGKTKFSDIIRPSDEIKIEIDLTENLPEYIARFNFSNNNKLASSGTVTYKTVNLNGTP